MIRAQGRRLVLVPEVIHRRKRLSLRGLVLLAPPKRKRGYRSIAKDFANIILIIVLPRRMILEDGTWLVVFVLNAVSVLFLV